LELCGHLGGSMKPPRLRPEGNEGRGVLAQAEDSHKGVQTQTGSGLFPCLG
jgi:hypothetical protein